MHVSKNFQKLSRVRRIEGFTVHIWQNTLQTIPARSPSLTRTLLLWEDNSQNNLQLPQTSLFEQSSSDNFYFVEYTWYLCDSSLKFVYNSVAECEKVTKDQNCLLLWIKKWPNFEKCTLEANGGRISMQCGRYWRLSTEVVGHGSLTPPIILPYRMQPMTCWSQVMMLSLSYTTFATTIGAT